MDVSDFFRADTLSALLLVTALKGAIVLVLALLATRLLARTSAATRHAVWVLAFIAALVMPALMMAVPGWNVPLLPEGGIAMGLDEEVALALPEASAQQVAGFSAGSFVSSAPAPDTLTLGALLLLFWGLGAFFVAARWMAGVLSAYALTRNALLVHDAEWNMELESVRSKLGIERFVILKFCAHTRTPMTWGVLHPVVLLPESAMRWTAERRHVVLTHELAHVRRLDGLTQWIAQAACVLHWFNPFVWKSYQRFLVEREHACDDYVLEEGARASSYAEHLLDIARGLRSQQRAELAMAPMAHRTQIEERLRSILNDQQRRERLSRGLLLIVCTLVLALVWPVAAISFVARQSEPITQSAPTPPASPDAPSAPLPIAPPAPPAPPPGPPPPPDPPLLGEPTAPPAPEPFRVMMVEPISNISSGPASSVVWTSERRAATDEQRTRKLVRDNRFNARIDASIAQEMEEAAHRIQVDVERLVHSATDQDWDTLDRQTRNVVRRIEAVVSRAQDWDETDWVERQAETLASIEEESAVSVAIELKRDARDSARNSQPSAHPSRTSSTCKTSSNN